MCIISVEQVSETHADAILSIQAEIDTEGKEECSGERAGEGLYFS